MIEFCLGLALGIIFTSINASAKIADLMEEIDKLKNNKY